MGLDLRLFPLDALNQDMTSKSTWGYSHTILNVPRDGSGTIEAIAKMRATKLPNGHDINGLTAGTVNGGDSDGDGFDGKFDEDPYGDPYKWVEAAALAKVLKRKLPGHPTTAYISALPGDNKVILGWH